MKPGHIYVTAHSVCAGDQICKNQNICRPLAIVPSAPLVQTRAFGFGRAPDSKCFWCLSGGLCVCYSAQSACGRPRPLKPHHGNQNICWPLAIVSSSNPTCLQRLLPRRRPLISRRCNKVRNVQAAVAICKLRPPSSPYPVLILRLAAVCSVPQPCVV